MISSARGSGEPGGLRCAATSLARKRAGGLKLPNRANDARNRRAKSGAKVLPARTLAPESSFRTQRAKCLICAARRPAIADQHALQVIHLMLNHPGEQPPDLEMQMCAIGGKTADLEH